MLSVGAIRFENRFCAVLLSRQVLCYEQKELSRLAVERPWLSLVRPFLSLAHTGMETASLPVGAPFLAAFIQENHSLVREP